jgi:5'-nucleotidase / UDP-sugar diphosphatase
MRRLALFFFIVVLCFAQDGVRQLTILHTNDLHARLLPDSHNLGGFAYVASVIRREREHCDHCLLVNAGDLVQGTPVSTLFKGTPVYEIANLFGFDVSTLGNHEFDYGWKQTKRFTEIANFPTVTANVVDSEGRLLTSAPYLIKEVNGIRVAIVGVVMGDLISAYTTPDLTGPWKPLPVVETVRKYAREVRGKSDLTVVLGHINPEERHAILREVPDVDVIITGHIHITNEEGYEGRVSVEGSAYGTEVGKLDLEVDVPHRKLVSWKETRLAVDAGTVQPAPDVLALVTQWEHKVSEIVDVKIGVAKHDIGGPALKKLIEQAMREEMHADFAWMNQGGIRDRIPQGVVLARNAWNIMPFDNKMAVAKMKGSEVPDVLRAGRTVDPAKEYTLAMSDFSATNEKERRVTRTANVKFQITDRLLRDLIIDWIKKQGTLE